MSDAADGKCGRDQTKMFQSQFQSTPGETSLLAGYERSTPAFDEFLADNGEIRPHYAKLLGALGGLSLAELQRRRDACERLVNE